MRRADRLVKTTCVGAANGVATVGVKGFIVLPRVGRRANIRLALAVSPTQQDYEYLTAVSETMSSSP